MSREPVDRRQFHRARANILVRPAGPLARVAPQRVQDISLGGLRAFADEPQKLGARLELELLFPEGGSATCVAEVVWAEELAKGAQAKWEMGLMFVQVEPEDLQRIGKLIVD
jgi:hypothetical protein